MLAGLSSSRAKQLAEEKLQNILRHVASLSGPDADARDGVDDVGSGSGAGVDEGSGAGRTVGAASPRACPEGDGTSMPLSLSPRQEARNDDAAAWISHDSMFEDFTNERLHGTPAGPATASGSQDSNLYLQAFPESCFANALDTSALATTAAGLSTTPQPIETALGSTTAPFANQRQPGDDHSAPLTFEAWDPSFDWDLLAASSSMDTTDLGSDHTVAAAGASTDMLIDPVSDLAGFEALLLQELQSTVTDKPSAPAAVAAATTAQHSPLINAPPTPTSARAVRSLSHTPAVHIPVPGPAQARSSTPASSIAGQSSTNQLSPLPSIPCAQPRHSRFPSYADQSRFRVQDSTPGPSPQTYEIESDGDVDMDNDVSVSSHDVHLIAYIRSPSTPALDRLPSLEDVCHYFDKHFGQSKQHVSLLLTRLFFAVGSPESLRQMRNALALARQNDAHIVSHASYDLISTVRALDDLDTTTNLSHILRRYYLVRLLDNKARLAHDLDDARTAEKPTKRRLKHDFANITVLRTGGDPAAVAREAARKRASKSRPRSNALTDLMRILYPNLAPKSAGGARSEAYTRKMAKMKNRLSCARNWYQFEQTFSLPILALIPCGGTFSISIDQ